MCRTYFTSDIHISHRKVAELRGFGEDLEAHDNTLAERWDRTVRCPKCVVYFLGDLAIGHGRPETNALEWVSARRGIKRAVLGNHDGAHPMHSNSHHMEARYREVFQTVRTTDIVRIEGEKVWLSHFPFAEPGGDHTPTLRHVEWRPPNVGQWLLHGHTHKADQLVHGRQIHIGLDAHNLRPVELGTVAKIIRDERAARPPI